MSCRPAGLSLRGSCWPTMACCWPGPGPGLLAQGRQHTRGASELGARTGGRPETHSKGSNQGPWETAAGCWASLLICSTLGADLLARPVPLSERISLIWYLGKLKGLNEVQHAAVPWIHYLARERAPALPPPPPTAPVGMAALMGQQGTQESALKARMIGRLSTETIPTLSVQRSACVLSIKITDPTLKM